MKKIILVTLLFASLACGLLENRIMPTPISVSAPNKAPSTVPALTYCKVRTGMEDGGLLNLRAGPGKSYASIRVLREGELILPANNSARDGWRNVIAGSVTGWVNSKYITCEVKP